VPKIVHIIASLHRGGAETMLCRLLQRMDTRCYPPVVIALMRGGSLEGEIRAMGIPVYHADMRQGRPSMRALAKVASILRRERPDVVHGWMVHGNLAAQFACLLVAPPRPAVIWAVHHTVDSLRREKPLTAGLIRLCAFLSSGRRAPREIVYVSRASRAQHEALGYMAAKGRVIPNGIDTESFAPSEAHCVLLRHELGLPYDAPLIGLMGRFHPQKDHRNFLRAAKMIAAKCPEATFILAGDGVDCKNLELAAMLKESGVEKSVKLLGERRDMDLVTSGLDIAVSASAYGESLSLALGEAMACGVPCVTTDLGDHGELVGSTGVVVKPEDPAALAEGCLSLLRMGREGRQSLGARARERIISHYSLAAAVQRYEELYSLQLPREEGD